MEDGTTSRGIQAASIMDETRTQIYSMWGRCSPARDSWLPEQRENKPVLLEVAELPAVCSSSNRKPIPISHVACFFSPLNIPMTGVEKRRSKRSFLLLLVSAVLKVLACPFQSLPTTLLRKIQQYAYAQPCFAPEGWGWCQAKFRADGLIT